MKKLFVVKKHNGKIIEHYENKECAKMYRDELGGIEAGYTIGRGPDHIGSHGNRNPKRGNK